MSFRLQETAMPQTVNLSNLAVELGNTSIHTAYSLQITVEATNDTSASKTPTIDEFLGILQNIAVVSDNTRYHYSLSGQDIAYRNAMFTSYGIPSRVIDKTFTAVAVNSTMSASFVLNLEEGDIIALMHDSVTLKGQFAPYMDMTNSKCPVTKVEIKPTIYELIPASDAATAQADLIARYGENYAGALEPKVYALEKSCDANTEITGFFNLPTGALLRGAMMKWSTDPLQFGLLATVPSRQELMRMNWDTAVAKDERRYRTKMPTHYVSFDYDTELALNGLGLDGRAFNRGDYQISARTPSGQSTTLRYVSFEMMYPATVGTAALNTGHRML